MEDKHQKFSKSLNCRAYKGNIVTNNYQKMKVAKGATFHYFLQNSYFIKSHNANINDKSLSFIYESKSEKDEVFIGK